VPGGLSQDDEDDYDAHAEVTEESGGKGKLKSISHGSLLHSDPIKKDAETANRLRVSLFSSQ